MCKAVSNDPFNLKYYLDRYKTRKMYDKAVDDFLPALEFVSNWFVVSKMIKKLHNAFFTDDDILFDSGNVTFFDTDMGIISVDLSK